MTSQPKPAPPTGDAVTATALGRPMGEALDKAVDKLTSQIFLFLIAYMILLIFLTAWASGLSLQVRLLLVVIPVLGIIAYVYLERKKLGNETRNLQVAVNATIARSEASVTGIRGKGPDSLSSVKVDVGYAAGKAKVAGIDNPAEDSSAAADAKYLVQVFEALDAEHRQELIRTALQMPTKARS